MYLYPNLMTEVDPGSDIAVGNGSIAVTSMRRSVTSYVWEDFGSNYFSGNFEFRARIRPISADTYSFVHPFVFTDVLGDAKSLNTAGVPFLGLSLYKAPSGWEMRLYESSSSSAITEAVAVASLSGSTDYYVKFILDRSVGTYGTVYLYVYSDTTYTTLVNSVSIALSEERSPFRYVQLVTSWNSSGAEDATYSMWDASFTTVPSEQELMVDYTIVDPGSDFTTLWNQIEVVSLPKNVDAYAYRDFGVGHFSGNFSFDFDFWFDSSSDAYSAAYIVALSNVLDDGKYLEDNEDLLGILAYKDGSDHNIIITESDAGSKTSATAITVSGSTRYYCTIERDESVGTYGTVYLRVYSNRARTTLVGEQSLTLTVKNDFRYFYAVDSYNSSSAEAISLNVSSIDLNEEDLPANWSRVCSITIDDTDIDGDLTDFTVVLDEDSLPSEMFDSDGSYPAKEGGGDIRFTTDDAGLIQIPVDVRAFHTDPDPANGYADIAVKVPSILASGGATIYVWYGNATENLRYASNMFGQHNAYDAYFEACWPLNESGADSTPQFLDRTVNVHHMTAVSMGGPEQVAGTVLNAQDTDGAADYADISTPVVTAYPFTISLIGKYLGPSATRSESSAVVLTDIASSGNYITTGFTNLGYPYGHVYVGGSGTWILASAAATLNDIAHIAYVCAGTTNRKIYYDGGNVGVDAVSRSLPSGLDKTAIGRLQRSDGDFWYKGQYDEIRIASIDRPAEWVKAEYSNLLTPGTFMSAGTPETPSGSDVAIETHNTLFLFGEASATVAPAAPAEVDGDSGVVLSTYASATKSGDEVSASSTVRFAQQAKTPANGPSMFFQFEPLTARIFLYSAGTGRLSGFDRLASPSSVVRTTPPAALGAVDQWMVAGKRKNVGFLSTYSGGVRKLARGRWGYEATDSWTVTDLSLDAYQYDVEGVAVDDENGWLYTLHVDTANGKLVLARCNIVDGSDAGQMDIPGVDDTNTPHCIWYDREFGQIWICYDETPDVRFARFDWNGTTLTEGPLFSTTIVDVVGFGRSGDYIIGYDSPSGQTFRFPWATPEALAVFGTTGDGTVTEGATNNVDGAFFDQWFNKLFLYDSDHDGATTWAVFSTQWGPMNWSYTTPISQSLKLFENPSDGFGAAYDILRNEAYGGGVPATFVERDYLEACSGFGNEYVLMTAGDFTGWAPRHALNLAIQQRRPLEDVLRDIMSNINGALTYQEGKIKAFVERPVQFTAHHFDRSNIREGTLKWSITSRRNVPNRVTVDHLNRYNYYRNMPVQANEESSQDAFSQTIEQSFAMIGISLPGQAVRMAYFLLDSAQASRVSTVFTANIEGTLCEVGDVITVTHDKPGWDNVYFRVLDIRELPNDEFQISCLQHVPDIHRFALGSIDETGGENVVIPFQDADPGLYGASQFTDAVKQLIRYRVFEDREEPRLVYLYGFDEYRPGPVNAGSISTKLATDAEYLQVVSFGTNSVTSWLLGESVSSSETDINVNAQIPFDDDLADIPEPGYVIIDDEVIYYESVEDNPTHNKPYRKKLKNCVRGQKGTVAAKHSRPSSFEIDKLYKFNSEDAAPSSRTWTVTTDDDGDELSCLKNKDDAIFIGWDDDTPNNMIMKLNRIIGFSYLTPGYAGPYVPPEDYTTDGGNKYSTLRWEYSTGDGTWAELPGIMDHTFNFKQDGYVYWDAPLDWAKTNEFLPGDYFSNSGGTKRFYIRITQMKDNKKNYTSEPESIKIDYIGDCSEEIPVHVLSGNEADFEFPTSMIGQSRDWKGVAVGLNGEVSLDARNPVVTYTIQNLSAPVLAPDNIQVGGNGIDYTVPNGTDAELTWNPVSRANGFGRQPFGDDGAGFGGEVQEFDGVTEVTEFLLQILVDGEVVRERIVSYSGTGKGSYDYTNARNVSDNGGFRSDFEVRVYSRDEAGRQSETFATATTSAAP